MSFGGNDFKAGRSHHCQQFGASFAQTQGPLPELEALNRHYSSLLQDNTSVQFNKHQKQQSGQRFEDFDSHLHHFTGRFHIADDLIHGGPEAKHFKMPLLPAMLPQMEMLGSSARRVRYQPELLQEDFEFLQKLGTEFGNSNIFSELGEAISSCDPDMKKRNESSSPSRDFDQDSLTNNPNLLSILQNNKDSLNLHQTPRLFHQQEPVFGGCRKKMAAELVSRNSNLQFPLS